MFVSCFFLIIIRFGDSIMRQANILQNQFKLDKLSNSNCGKWKQKYINPILIFKTTFFNTELLKYLLYV